MGSGVADGSGKDSRLGAGDAAWISPGTGEKKTFHVKAVLLSLLGA